MKSTKLIILILVILLCGFIFRTLPGADKPESVNRGLIRLFESWDLLPVVDLYSPQQYTIKEIGLELLNFVENSTTEIEISDLLNSPVLVSINGSAESLSRDNIPWVLLQFRKMAFLGAGLLAAGREAEALEMYLLPLKLVKRFREAEFGRISAEWDHQLLVHNFVILGFIEKSLPEFSAAVRQQLIERLERLQLHYSDYSLLIYRLQQEFPATVTAELIADLVEISDFDSRQLRLSQVSATGTLEIQTIQNYSRLYYSQSRYWQALILGIKLIEQTDRSTRDFLVEKFPDPVTSEAYKTEFLENETDFKFLKISSPARESLPAFELWLRIGFSQ